MWHKTFAGIAGKNTKQEFNAPCRTTKLPREVPGMPWYRSAIPQMCMAGFLPFSAIYIELYYIFASVWGHKVSKDGIADFHIVDNIISFLSGG